MNIPSPAFQFYPRDWLSSQRVQLLSLEEEGAYLRLLCHCWLHGSIPDDEALAAKLLGKGGFNVVLTTVLSMFQPGSKPGTLTHDRLEAERRKQADWRDKSAEGGRNSAKKRLVKLVDNQHAPQGSYRNGANQKATLQSASAVCSLLSASNPPEGAALPFGNLADQSPVVVTFACAGKPDTWDFRESLLKEMSPAYPSVDVRAEAIKAASKIQTKAVSKKTANGMSRFLWSWMDRAQNGARGPIPTNGKSQQDRRAEEDAARERSLTRMMENRKQAQ